MAHRDGPKDKSTQCEDWHLPGAESFGEPKNKTPKGICLKKRAMLENTE